MDKVQAAIEELNQFLTPEVPVSEQIKALEERFKLENIYELAKLGGLDDADRPEDAELDEVRRHLEPLGLAPEGTPVAELARLAALKITEK